MKKTKNTRKLLHFPTNSSIMNSLIALVTILIVFGVVLFCFPNLYVKVTSLFAPTKSILQEQIPWIGDESSSIRQIITKNSSTSRTIMWNSVVSQPNGVVEFRIQGEEDWHTVAAKENKVPTFSTALYSHEAHLDELQPGTTYEYRISNQSYKSDIHTFVTASGEDFTALIFPDSQSNDYTDWKHLVASAWTAHHKANFFINMGDLVDNGADLYQWNAWFDATEDMISSIPLAPVLGNHEMYDLGWKNMEPVPYTTFFAVPSNGSSKFNRRYYSFDYNGVHFTVLDTQFVETEDSDDLKREELEWLKRDLDTTQMAWKVILMHRDSLTYASERNNRTAGINDIGTVFMPIFDEYHVDLVFSAHLHTYRNRGHIEDFKRSDKGPLYILTGVAGNVRYSGLWREHPLDVVVAPQPETDNYLVLEKKRRSTDCNGIFT